MSEPLRLSALLKVLKIVNQSRMHLEEGEGELPYERIGDAHLLTRVYQELWSQGVDHDEMPPLIIAVKVSLWVQLKS